MNSTILQEVDKLDWDWATPFPAEDVLNYKKFMVCKAVANDAEGRIVLDSHNSEPNRRQTGGLKIRPRMSPTPEVDAVWHAHLLRPKSYAALMAVLLKDSEFALIDHFLEAEGDSAEEKAGRLRETGRVWRMLYGDSGGHAFTAKSADSVPAVRPPATSSAVAEAAAARPPAAERAAKVVTISYTDPPPSFQLPHGVPMPQLRDSHVSVRHMRTGEGDGDGEEVLYKLHLRTYHRASSFMVKRELATHVGCAQKQLRLTCGGVDVCNSASVLDRTDDLWLTVNPPRPVEQQTLSIRVKTLTGKVFPLRMSPLDSVEYATSLIHEREGIPACQQRLIFGGRQLEESRTMRDYEFTDGDCLMLVLRLTGC